MSHNKDQCRQRVLALLADGEKTARQLGTNRLLLSRMIKEGLIKERRTKDKRFAFAENRVYTII